MAIDLDWRSIAGVVAPLAPKLGAVLGTALFGPLGTTIGGLAGSAIATTFGTDATPEAVGKAIAQDPKAGDKLARLEELRGQEILAQAQAEIARAEQQGLTSRENISQVNQTIREETAKGVSWWHWRHLLGYVPVALGLELVALVPFMAVGTLSAADVALLVGAVTPPLAIFSGLLGYVAQDTSAVKVAAMTGQPVPGILSTVIKGVTGGKK
jgi:hypothetical protein